VKQKTLERMLDEDKIHQLRQYIQNFCTHVRYARLHGKVDLSELYKWYDKMKPALHEHSAENKVDMSAIKYALQRLPFEEMPQTDKVYVKNSTEDLSNIEGIKTLACKYRRRQVYKVTPNTIEFIARESETDIFDIVTTLIMYNKEATKIKNRLAQEKELISQIKMNTNKQESKEKNQVMVMVANKLGTTYKEIKDLDETLDYKLFKLLTNIHEQHNNNIQIEFDEEFSITDAQTKAKQWRKRIENELNIDPSKSVHIISSNTHSIVNCLTGFAKENEQIIRQLVKKDPTLKEISSNNPSELYYLTQQIAKKNKDFLNEKISYEKKLGIQHVEDTAGTGIDAQIINLEKIDYNKIDPRIKEKIKELKSGYIINIDYAFGRQGSQIMRQLCQLFNTQIDSISIIGKAGIVCGDKYDIMLPTYFKSQIEGGVYGFSDRENNLKPEDLMKLVNGHKVHSKGPMLTVPGTAIQNKEVLEYYKYEYHILGLEMEGIPNLEEIKNAKHKELLKKDVKLNIGYWASDNPQKPDQHLGGNHMDKGFIPTYALSIAVLNNILN